MAREARYPPKCIALACLNQQGANSLLALFTHSLNILLSSSYELRTENTIINKINMPCNLL